MQHTHSKPQSTIYIVNTVHVADGTKLKREHWCQTILPKHYNKLKKASPLRVWRNLKYSTTFLYLNSAETISSPNILSELITTWEISERICAVWYHTRGSGQTERWCTRFKSLSVRMPTAGWTLSEESAKFFLSWFNSYRHSYRIWEL